MIFFYDFTIYYQKIFWKFLFLYFAEVMNIVCLFVQFYYSNLKSIRCSDILNILV